MAQDFDIGYASSSELVSRYSSGDLSPSEAISSILGRIDALQPMLNAFSVVMQDDAMASAKAAEQRYRNGTARPLEGVPVTIKDAYDVAGYETATCSFAIEGKIAAADNPVVARLRQAGAVILGKTTMSELGWSGLSHNPVTGITHNPWRHGYNAGASSAGAGVAAAAGFGPLHLGSDGAGSIRMPAHFCGVFGLKPTYGRVPHVPLSNNDYATYIGPMARSVEDAALMLEVMAGPHPLDHTCCEAPPRPYRAELEASLKGKRIAFSPDLGHARVDDEVAVLVRQAVSALSGALKADVIENNPAWGEMGRDIGRFFWSVLWGRRVGLLSDFENRMGRDLVACIREGAGHSAADYLNWREHKYAYIAQIGAYFEDWDYLVTPVASVAAFPAELVRPAHWPEHGWDWLEWSEFLYPFNMSGNPAASVPCGFTPSGLPVGLQIVGKRFDDLGVLQVARALQRELQVSGRRPDLPLRG